MRRGQHEGTIRRRKDTRWEGRVSLDWLNGRRVRKSVYATTREEAARLLSELVTQHNKGLTVPHGRDTVGSFLRLWLEQVRATIKPRTWESYELYLRRHAIPNVGTLRLGAIRPDHIRTLLSRKLKEGLSAQSVIHLRTILHTAFQQAVEDKLISWNPVSSAVKRPSVRRYKYQVLEPD